ncbi:MAG TPA: hypothetical protein VLJ37_01870 [bacterium]|nr:hypothetical protein [bacterium]
MGDGARIQSTDFIGGVGGFYVARPGAPRGGDRFGYQAMLGANLHAFVDEYRSFRVILAGTAGREEAVSANSESLTTVGGAVEAHFAAFPPVVYLGAGVNPRAVIFDSGRSPEFELGIFGRVSATFGHVGFSLNVGTGLRLGDIERSSVEVGLGAFVNLF